MAGFIAAAMLLVLLALAIVLRPLWRDARRTAVVVALALPLATAGLYLLLGTPAALDPTNVEAPRNLDDAVDQLQRRLAEEPGQLEGWLLLGRSRMAQKRYGEAREAFARAHALAPEDIDVMVEYADAQLRATPDGRMPDAATALLERAIAAQPNHERGLFFLGVQRLQADQPAQAVELWERLLPLLDAQTAAALQPQIDAARSAAGMAPAVVAEVTPEPAAGAASIAVTVAIAPALLPKLPPAATLFVFARTAEGAGPPVAVKRLAANGFPLQLTLSDNDSLMPTQKLSAQSRVLLMARISFSGDAAPAAGDLEAEAQLLDLGAGAEATLTIDRVRP